MSKAYIAYHFMVTPKEPATEILIAELAELPFESFQETEEGLTAFIVANDDYEGILSDIYILESPEFKISYTTEHLAPENWNINWETNFQPIAVNDDCYVRAPFHAAKGVAYEIVIEPKMSFGTGHHETTFLMLEQLLTVDFESKTVLDMGSGTAILAILAAKKGAKAVTAIDIDRWCFENSLENIERNNTPQIEVLEGDVALIENKNYEVIIANINRNILLQDIPAYNVCLNKNGLLFLSGFYTEDVEAINLLCESLSLVLVKSSTKNNWVCLQYQKL